MLRFLLIGGPDEGADMDAFNYQWGIVHVALMITTAPVVQVIKRYIQSRSLELPTGTALPFPREAWQYSCTDHIYEGLDDLAVAMSHPEYQRRVKPHEFGANRFVMQMIEDGRRLLGEEADPYVGGVKLLNLIRRKPSVDRQSFLAEWLANISEAEARGAAEGLIIRVTRSPAFEVDPAYFANSPFAGGAVNQFDGVEEVYFRDETALSQYLQNLESAHDPLADVDRCLCLAVKERIVWDQTKAPLSPAILDPGSFDAMACASEPADGKW